MRKAGYSNCNCNGIKRKAVEKKVAKVVLKKKPTNKKVA